MLLRPLLWYWRTVFVFSTDEIIILIIKLTQIRYFLLRWLLPCDGLPVKKTLEESFIKLRFRLP